MRSTLLIILFECIIVQLAGQAGRIIQNNNMSYHIIQTETRLQLSERSRYNGEKIPAVKRVNDSLQKIYSGRFFVSINYGSTGVSKGVQTTPDTLTFINLANEKGALKFDGHFFFNEHFAAGASVGFVLFPKMKESVSIIYERPRRATVTGRGNGGVLVSCLVNAKYFFLKDNLRPYINAGAGILFTYLKGIKVERSPVSGEKPEAAVVKRYSFLTELGGGLQWRISNRWTLQGGADYFFTGNFNRPAGGVDAYRGAVAYAGISYIFYKQK
jgi:hypothetical protein